MASPRVPALSTLATEGLVERLGEGPGRLFELGSEGVHAPALALAGWTVVVAEASPSALARARQRAAGFAEVSEVAALADGSFDVDVGDGARYLRPGGRLVQP
jgi:hypothetical protein